jgi:hypothetical protein
LWVSAKEKIMPLEGGGRGGRIREREKKKRRENNKHVYKTIM